MAIVNFTIPKTLEQHVEQLIKTKGFASRAEFFRFAAMHYIDSTKIAPVTSYEDQRFSVLVQALKNELGKHYKNKNLPSLQHQLAEL